MVKQDTKNIITSSVKMPDVKSWGKNFGTALAETLNKWKNSSAVLPDPAKESNFIFDYGSLSSFSSKKSTNTNVSKNDFLNSFCEFRGINDPANDSRFTETAKRFQKYDLNNDGILDANEYNALMKGTLQEHGLKEGIKAPNGKGWSMDRWGNVSYFDPKGEGKFQLK